MKKNIIAVCLGLLVSLVVGEMVVRIFKLAPAVVSYNDYFRLVDNPRIVYEIIPGIHKDQVNINKQGFKDEEFVRQKTDNRIRIVMLGDSITEGAHVPSGKTFSDRLEAHLNSRARAIGSSLNYEVMNFGVGGYNLDAEVETLKTKALAYSPDVVVLNMFYNDDEDIPGIKWLFIDPGFNEKERILIIKRYLLDPDNKFMAAVRKILYKSKLYLFLADRLYNVKSLRQRLERLGDSKRDKVSVNRELIERNFREITSLRDNYHFKLLICIHSFLADYEHPNNRIFEEISRKFDFPCFHIINYYHKKSITTGLLKVKGIPEDNMHPNEAGHTVIAESLFEELKKNHYIDERL